MSEKKGTRSDTAMSERAKEPGAACRQATTSIDKSTTSTPPGQAGIISRLLSRGQGNAIPLKQLIALTKLPERVVRRQIAAERKRGIMILADSKSGYYLPDSPDDLRRFSRSMAHRANEIMVAARLAEDAYAEALGQNTMKGWQDNG